MAEDSARTLAVFIDFENLAIGFKHRRGDFNMNPILERLVEEVVAVFGTITGLGKQFAESLQGEEAQVGDVENAALRIAPFALVEQSVEKPQVAAIWQADDDLGVW